TGRPFEWAATPLASGYHLEIGTRFGGNDLHDSGSVAILRRFVGTLPMSTMLYGRLSAFMDGSWTPLDFRFTVAANGSAAPNVIPASLWATDFVRSMADASNVPLPGTLLADLVAAEGWGGAYCSDYASVL